jgi:hypothetical protein
MPFLYTWLVRYIQIGLFLHKDFSLQDHTPSTPQVNGIWGLVATGLLASPRLQRLTYENDVNPGFFYSFGEGKPNATLLLCQVVEALFIIGWTLVTMAPFFLFLNYRGWLRSDTYEEIVGLDMSYHGGGMRLSVDDGAGIQFVQAHRRRRQEEAKKDHHQFYVHTEETAKALDTVEETSSGGEGPRDVEHQNNPSTTMISPIQPDVVEIDDPSSYAMDSTILYG